MTDTTILDDYDGESLREFRDQLQDVALTVVERGSSKGWKLLSATFDSGDYYVGPSDGTEKRDGVRVRLESIGKVRGQKISFSARVENGVSTVGQITVGEKVY